MHKLQDLVRRARESRRGRSLSAVFMPTRKAVTPSPPKATPKGILKTSQQVHQREPYRTHMDAAVEFNVQRRSADCDTTPETKERLVESIRAFLTTLTIDKTASAAQDAAGESSCPKTTKKTVRFADAEASFADWDKASDDLLTTLSTTVKLADGSTNIFTNVFPYNASASHPAGEISIPWGTSDTLGTSWLAALPILRHELCSILPSIDWNEPCPETEVLHSCIACQHASLLWTFSILHQWVWNLRETMQRLVVKPNTSKTGPLRKLTAILETQIAAWRQEFVGRMDVPLRMMRDDLAVMDRFLLQEEDEQRRLAKEILQGFSMVKEHMESMRKWFNLCIVKMNKLITAVGESDSQPFPMHLARLEALREVLMRTKSYIIGDDGLDKLLSEEMFTAVQEAEGAPRAFKYLRYGAKEDVTPQAAVEDLAGELEVWRKMQERFEQRWAEGRRLVNAAFAWTEGREE